MKTISLWLVSWWIALGVQAEAKEPVTFAVESGKVSYKIVHKFHDVVGTSKQAKATAKLQSNGTLELRASVPVASFESGNDNRDVHMLEAVEGAKYKTVELRAQLTGFRLPKKFPAKAKMKVPATVKFHGVERQEELSLAIQFLDAKRVSVNGTFTVSLDAYQVERPSLMFVKIDDPMTVTADLQFKRAR